MHHFGGVRSRRGQSRILLNTKALYFTRRQNVVRAEFKSTASAEIEFNVVYKKTALYLVLVYEDNSVNFFLRKRGVQREKYDGFPCENVGFFLKQKNGFQFYLFSPGSIWKFFIVCFVV